MSQQDDFGQAGSAGGGSLADDEGVAAGRSVFGDDPAETGWSDTGGAGTPRPTASEPRLEEADPREIGDWTDHTLAPEWADPQEALPPVESQEPVGTAPGDEDFFGYDDQPTFGVPVGAPGAGGFDGAAERDMPMAVIIGVTMSAVILVAMQFAPVWALIVATLVIGLAAVELLSAARVAGYQPAVALGLAAVVAMPLAVYWRGMDAVVVVLVLTVVFGALWYLMGVGVDGPVRGLSVTVMTVAYVGVLGAHAALILRIPEHGTGLLTAAIILTVAHDVSSLVVGRAAGRTPLSRASPNKTLEGLVGGVVVTILVGVAMGVLAKPAPVAAEPGGLWTVILLAVVVAIVVPIGDLAESLLKRDLGIKDMGTLLPGHGGVLDRFDAMLFALPATYYVALMVEVI